MAMTKKQFAFMFSKPPGKPGLWWTACEIQGWNYDDREKRLEVFKEALGSAKSFKEFSNADFGHVKATLERYAGELRGAEKEVNPERCNAPALRHKILSQIIPCLGVFFDDPIAYAEAILLKEFKTHSLEHLGEIRQPGKPGKRASSPLERFFWTLSARLNQARKKAGITAKEMREKAGVRV